MATLRTRTTRKPNGTKVVTFVIDTNRPSLKTLTGGEHAHVVSERNAKSATREGKSKPNAGTYVALRINNQPNTYLVGSRERAIEIAKRAGILDDTGKLTPFFQGVH
ncbi:hypothetical protein [Achromobacter sp.]|uniref:hypothetical protein n=1 Tax=Achromobacter sp. TaxID=134375 RepID=UPI003C75190E